MFGHQSLDAELQVLHLKYGPPNGRTLLALIDGEVVAAGAYRRLSETDCELKRLYVRDAAKGRGVGRGLSEALFAAARDDGYSVMKLDTARLMVEAQTLYAALGFEPITPYLTYPAHLLPELVFMEKQL